MVKKRISRTLSLALLLTGCGPSAPSGPRVAESHSIRYEIPAGWVTLLSDNRENPLDLFSGTISGPEREGMFSPLISMSLERKGVDRASVERYWKNEREARAPNDRLDPITELSVDGARAWSYSFSYLNTNERALHRTTKDRPPKDVEYRETHVYVDGPTLDYKIHFACPVSLYGKYEPEFRRFLLSIKHPPQP